MLGGRRLAREIGQHGSALINAAPGIAFAEHNLFARLVQALGENEFAAMVGFGGQDPGPAGQHLGEARDIGLRIAAADAERVQFENFAGEIFVQSLVAIDAGDGVGAHRLDVVEIEQHRRMAFGGQQKIGEAAEHMRADRLALIGAGHGNDLVGGDTKMVRPEPHQPFDKADIGSERQRRNAPWLPPE